MLDFLIYTVLAFVCAFACASMAETRNRSSIGWGLAAFFLALIGALFGFFGYLFGPATIVVLLIAGPAYDAAKVGADAALSRNDLLKLESLKASGTLTEQEFEKAKERLWNKNR